MLQLKLCFWMLLPEDNIEMKDGNWLFSPHKQFILINFNNPFFLWQANLQLTNLLIFVQFVSMCKHFVGHFTVVDSAFHIKAPVTLLIFYKFLLNECSSFKLHPSFLYWGVRDCFHCLSFGLSRAIFTLIICSLLLCSKLPDKAYLQSCTPTSTVLNAAPVCLPWMLSFQCVLIFQFRKYHFKMFFSMEFSAC